MKNIGYYNFGVSIVGAFGLIAMLTGCAGVAQPLSSVATKIAGFQCDRSAEFRAAQRQLYFDNNGGRILFGICPDDDGYEEAKEKYIDEPRRLHGYFAQSILDGDTESILQAVINAGVKSGRLTVDADGCIILAGGRRNCPAIE